MSNIDDLSLCGLEKHHAPCWRALRSKVKLDPQCFIGPGGTRILGDGPGATTLIFNMPEYAEPIVQTCCEITGVRADQ